MTPVTIIDEEIREESINNERRARTSVTIRCSVILPSFYGTESLSLVLSLLTSDDQESLGKTDVDAKQKRDAKTHTRVLREQRETSLHPLLHLTLLPAALGCHGLVVKDVQKDVGLNPTRVDS